MALLTSLSRTASRERNADTSDDPIVHPLRSASSGETTTAATHPLYPDGEPNSSSAAPWPPRLTSRTTSHSLLSTSPTPSSTSRKGRFSETSTVDGSISRPSISMPPPLSKPSSIYKPFAARRPSAVLTGEGGFRKDMNMDGKGDRETTNGLAVQDDLEKTPSIQGAEWRPAPTSYASLTPPDSALRPPKPSSVDSESNRLSFSSLYSLGSAIYSGATGGMSGPQSAASSNAGSVKSGAVEQPYAVSTGIIGSSLGSNRGDATSVPTTATDPISVTTSSHTHNSGSGAFYKDSEVAAGQITVASSVVISSPPQSAQSTGNAAAKHLEAWSSGPLSRPPQASRRSRSRTERRFSGSTAASSASPNNSERGAQVKPIPLGKIGVCALDVKARSKPSRNILTRLQNNGEFEVVVFGDKVILDEAVENWPLCDFLISFFSDGFPLDKAIAYAHLRKPFCVNDLPMQKVLWDRRICLRILDSMGVPTPKRLEVNRDGGPTLESADLAHHVYHMSGVLLDGPENGTGGGMPVPKSVSLIDDGDTLQVDGILLKKPFVEKPINGEDHNIRIYFPKSHEGGGGRKLFRKIGNKSSEWDSNLIIPQAVTELDSSYVYEQFLDVDNAEDIKAYTVGPDFCHAETRKSPVVDGLVRRNTHGKEIRYITSLTTDEATMASRIADGFGQRICGFDLLRVASKSYVIDVNGWSFVKDNNEYYDKCAGILRQMFIKAKLGQDGHELVPEDRLDNPQDVALPQRKETNSHRSVLKTILKSPSLTRLAGSQSGHRTHGKFSPDISTSATPIMSPSSLDNRQGPSLGSLPAAKETLLPPPAVPGAHAEALGLHPAPPADLIPAPAVPPPASKHSWKLKGMVAVIRHADRTPKQKFKFTFHTQPFIDLLKGHQEEVLLKGEAALSSVLNAVKLAMQEGIEDPEKLMLLRTSLARKGAWSGTKVQIKPMFRKRKPEQVIGTLKGHPPAESGSEFAVDSPTESSDITRSQRRSDSLAGITLSRFSAVENDLAFDKLQLIIKWGGEPTHSARYQSQDLGENMRNDLLLMNREALDNVRVFTSSEKRVSTSAQIWTASFLDQKDVAEDFISVRKDLLDDSNAAKDVMDKVKKKLKLLLREGHEAPPQFAWPMNMPEPSIVVRKVAELMRFHRRVMRHNYSKFSSGAAASLSALTQSSEGTVASSPGNNRALAQAQAVASIQARWCCGEDAELFKERWEKLFSEFCDSEKVDPSKISELYDTMKFDALHNRQFLEWVFTPSASILEEDAAIATKSIAENGTEVPKVDPRASPRASSDNQDRKGSSSGDRSVEKPPSNNLAQRMGFRRKSVMNAASPQPTSLDEPQESYFKLFHGSGQTKAKQDVRLEKLRELYKLAKVLFDFVCPQEYGIDDSEKLEIGLLTSLPLLKEIVKDLEEVQASEDAKSFIYFTKESHIYTLLNCILEGGIKTKIERNAIPELDYLSQICFELYESEDKDADTFAYSIRITITPGCHTFDPLDVQLDSKHSIGCAPKRSLTAHADWKEVTETLRAKFDTVKLPKSFLAINLSERHAHDASKGDVDS